MLVVDILSHREVHLTESVEVLLDFVEQILMFNIEHGIFQALRRLQMCDLGHKTALVQYVVARTLAQHVMTSQQSKE